MNIIGLIGHNAIQFFVNAVELVVFIVTVLRRGFLYLFKNKRNGLIKNAVVREIIFDGIDSLFPTILILSIIIGFSITAQLIIVLQAIGAETEIVTLLIRYLALELSPLMTAIVIICRCVSAKAIELGNMSINQEVKGLELLGIDVLVLLAFPSMLAKAISQMTLSCYFSSLSVTLGILFSAVPGSISNLKFFLSLIDSIEPMALFYFLLKNLLFGLIIGANACFHGLNAKQSVTEVPQRTQKAIMHSMLAVFAINALFIL